MKKLLLSVFVLGLTSGLSAQEILSENATALEIGDISEDLTGATPGQGGWRTLVNSGGETTDFQVVDMGGEYGNAILMTGPGTAVTTGTAKFLFKDLESDWNFRTAGNDIAEVELNFFTGAASGSTGTWRVVLFDTTGTKILGGLLYTYNTRAIRGLSYYNNAGTLNNYSFNFGAGGAVITLQQNTWYRMGFSFNKTTGEVKFREGSTPALFNGYLTGASIGTDVAEIDFVTATGAANAEAGAVTFDNLTVGATATDQLLGTTTVGNGMTVADVNIFPNPVNDVMNISNTDHININKVTIIDINGRTVKTVTPNSNTNIEVNVSELKSGAYMINIESDYGMTTKKMIKK